MDIKDILTGSPEDVIERLQEKSTEVRSWTDLEKEYDPRKHSVADKSKRPDRVLSTGDIEAVSRIGLGYQRLAVKRMTGLMFGVPTKRIYKPDNDKQAEVAQVIERIFKRNRIDAVDIERGNYLFAGCEFATLWYAVENPNKMYGIDSHLKIRCRSYSPMKGDRLYPLFDEYDDLLALSFRSTRKSGDKSIEYFDTYTSGEHIQWTKGDKDWEEAVREKITIGKIPAIYCHRPTPIWEETTETIINEIEWTLSRNGDYIRVNSKPKIAVFADEEIREDEEGENRSETKDEVSLDVFHYPKGSEMKYVTWEQAVQSLEFQIKTLGREFFTQLQLPDISYENMKATPMSGEARKLMFVDAHLKVTEESGRFLEAFSREINVVKSFAKLIMPTHIEEIDALEIEVEITPFSITDDKDTINNIMTATGGKPILSQLDGIKTLGWSEDAGETQKQILQEAQIDIAESSF